MTAQKLLIVESPAKVKTIAKYLGREFIVLASFGHIRDLPKKSGSIDIDNNFLPQYQIIVKNKPHVERIIEAATNAKEIYLATDPDREGEAIAWHIKEVLALSGITENIKRITFNEITEHVIKEAVRKPRDINIDLVQAQQARLTLDYLIGFNVSPLLWKKVRYGLSAGRVQSPALRLICEREQAIAAFIVEYYFSIHVNTNKSGIAFEAKLIELEHKKLDLKSLGTKELAEAVIIKLQHSHTMLVKKINIKDKKQYPIAPFITSSLQIAAANKLGFTAEQTMKIAQSLYEGVQLQNETTGLISYMRTDSVHLSVAALTEIRAYITSNFAAEYLPKTANTYKSKAKNAQEAHEAIRPTSIERTPASVANFLNKDQARLYELIWECTLASQLMPAILSITSVELQLAVGLFKATGSTVKFAGFTAVYQDIIEDAPADELAKLPKLEINEVLPVDKLSTKAHQTEPKPLYSESTLIKSLEELGIGRPSTYVPILSTLKRREYIVLDKKRLIPTEIGEIVNSFLSAHLSKYVDLHFTATLEETLDEIAHGTANSLVMLTAFWKELETAIKEKNNIPRHELTGTKITENCPECQAQLSIQIGKYGKYIGCSNYPTCKYIRKLATENNSVATEPIDGKLCPKDSAPLILVTGKYGKFISCSNFPKCKYHEASPPPADAIACPSCNTGKLISKTGRFGMFYSCNNYPDCKTILKYEPIAQSCTACKCRTMMRHITKTKGTRHICPQCAFTIQVNESCLPT